MSTQKPPRGVRVGLTVVRAMVLLKRFLVKTLSLLLVLLAPFGRFLLKSVIVPLYSVTYRLRRRMAEWYRPAKNRLMYVLCNRYAAQVTTVIIVLFAILVDTRFASARSQSLEFGQQSLLYSYVTGKNVELIEETASPLGPQVAASYVEGQALTVQTADTWTVPTIAVDDSTLTADSVLTTPSSATTPTGLAAVSAAPRTETITYTVGAGDTLSSIAQAHGISLNTLLWANGLTARSTIKPGQSLRILPVTGVEHKVARGETLGAIAKKYGVDIARIREANGITNDAAIKIGAALMVPGGEPKAPVPTTVAKAKSVGVKEIFTTAPSGTTKSSAPASGASMVWPTDLHVIVRGLKWGHTGVDIDCNGRANGTSTNDNYAAADGVVRFSGWKNGYGSTVEIDHGNGLITRYGHHYSLYVKKGDVVTAGTPLGRCGSTGNSTGTHLHFEVIANGKFKNPLDYTR